MDLIKEEVTVVLEEVNVVVKEVGETWDGQQGVILLGRRLHLHLEDIVECKTSHDASRRVSLSQVSTLAQSMNII